MDEEEWILWLRNIEAQIKRIEIDVAQLNNDIHWFKMLMKLVVIGIASLLGIELSPLIMEV